MKLTPLLATVLLSAACSAQTPDAGPPASESGTGVDGRDTAPDAAPDRNLQARPVSGPQANSPAPAESWTAPDLYRVTGVATNDVLNVRAEPRADALKLGEFGPDAAPVEVIAVREIDGARWGQVLEGGRPGWVNMAYLSPFEPETVAGSALPASLICTGTEPFWGLEFSADAASYTDPEREGDRTTLIETVVSATARGEFPVAVDFQGDDWAVIARERCSDGMSSDDYQWSVQYFTRIGESPAFLQGCCRIEPD